MPTSNWKTVCLSTGLNLLTNAPVEYGLTKPQITVKLWKKTDEAPVVLTIGTTDEQKNLVYARNMDGHPVAFDVNELVKVWKTLFDFRDKKLVSFNEIEVLRMSVRYGEHELVVARKDDKWVPEKPERNYWKIAKDVLVFTSSLATVYLVIEQATTK